MTENVYAVPAVKPETVHDRTADVVQVLPPGADVTVYPVIAAPPLKPGAVQETAALLELDRVPVTDVGACGCDRTPHLRDRYSSTARRWVVLSALLKVITSPTWPTSPRFA